MAHITLTICDECARQGSRDTSRETTTYTVQAGSTRARTDLCAEHDTYLRNILTGHGTDLADQPRPVISEARFEELCADMDDIAKLRQEYITQHPEEANSDR